MTFKDASGTAEIDHPAQTGWVTGVDHYENFPVASRLMPAKLRPAVVAIYRFARYADDVADEGNATAESRLTELQRLRDALESERADSHPIIGQLKPHLEVHRIPIEPLLALLSAFEQDVRVNRYQHFEEVLNYCTRSANPVGQMILHLFGVTDSLALERSNAICSALQLINFVQDFSIDWQRNRLYIPTEELQAAGLLPEHIDEALRQRQAQPALRQLLRRQAERASALLESGASLPAMVPLRLNLELRAILAGARRILELLSHSDWDPINHRPKLNWRDAPALVRLMMTRNASR